jgi:hypothetical protein
MGNVTTTNFDPSPLEYGTTYYWAIDEVNATDVFEGEVWNFTTVEYDPNIVFDNTSSTLVSTNSSISFSHTIGFGEDRILIVGAAGEDNTAADMVITGVTYNGAAMTPVSGSQAVAGTTTLQKSELYYMLEADLPPAGTYTVVVSYAGAMDQASGGAISLLHAAQEPPEAVAAKNNSGQTSISTSITTETDNAWVVDVIGSGNTGTFAAATSGMQRRWSTSDYTSAAAGSTTPVPVAGPVTISWTNSGANRLAHSLISLAPANRVCPLMDLNGDCDMDWLDVGVLAAQWLNTGDCSASSDCADLDGSLTVDFYDFAMLGDSYGI